MVGLCQFFIEDNAKNKTIATVNVDKIPFSGEDTEKPNAHYLLSNYDWTNNSINISVYASDNQGIKSIATPDGQVVFDSCLEYSVSENGEYEFVVEDLSGNIETLSVNVDNLDSSLPEGSVDIVALDDGNVCAFIEAWDEDSGISNIILPGNLMINGDSSNVILDREKKYEAIITDNAGNTNKITFTVEDIEEVPEDSDDSDNNSNNNGMISGDNNLNSSDNSSNTNNGSNNSNLNSSDNNSSNNITDTHIESNESENSDSIANTDTDAALCSHI